MRRTPPALLVLMLCGLVPGCTNDHPLAPRGATESAPAISKFNIEVILRGQGFGLVKFRQPKDDEKIVYLDTWVRDLAPNSQYQLQRAVDVTLDDDCTGTGWLTLGRGAQSQNIATDEQGTGRAELFRDLSAVPLDSEFDIHFRVIDALTQAVVLESECYQFRVSL